MTNGSCRPPYYSSLKSVSAIEMPTSYHRNADEMLFKTDNVRQKVDAKKTNAKYWMAVRGREHINFTSAFISPLSLFWVENKKKLIYFHFNEKQNNFAFYFHFTFNSMAIVGHHNCRYLSEFKVNIWWIRLKTLWASS